MKVPTIKICYAIIIATLLGCTKDLATYSEYEAYTYASTDREGGKWKTTLMTSPEQIVIDAPKDVSSTAFKSQLEQTKTASITPQAAEEIAYWTNNPVVRWNEIARELAAKYNLTPAPNADGTYPAPSASNPGVYPYFPFAHPPYAARAFAYLSTAHLDALIATWHYKEKYNQVPLHAIDASISQAYPKTDIPSYPSEGAVVAAVSREILSAMFPLEKEYLLEISDKHKKSLIEAGLHVSDDIMAGDSLGRGIAKAFLARAKTDGMGKAQVSKNVSDSIATAAQNTYGWRWVNMEDPVRPVGVAPLYGKVKPWNIVDITTVRPQAPPAIGSAAYQAAVDELIAIQKNPTKEQQKIANFWSDGLGTYTPPGHWNRIACEHIVNAKMNPLRAARTLAYLNQAIQDAGISCWDTKYHYYYPRPINVIEGFKTSLGTPNFPGYTSGHSTFSAAAAGVLAYIFPSDATKFNTIAKEASESRIYGGIHFRYDCEVGLEVGKKVAVAAIMRAQNDGAK
jgi:hypothetical protein